MAAAALRNWRRQVIVEIGVDSAWNVAIAPALVTRSRIGQRKTAVDYSPGGIVQMPRQTLRFYDICKQVF